MTITENLQSKGEGQPDPIDIHVGQRLRLRRKLMGLSQEQLGKSVSITLQQIQKYEKGTNRISASKLYRFSELLNVPVSFFFDGLAEVAADPVDAQTAEIEKDVDRRETLELVRNYYAIGDMPARQAVFEAVKSMARTLRV